MWDITYLFGNFLLGLLGATFTLVMLGLFLIIIWRIGISFYRYLNKTKKPAKKDYVIIGILVYILIALTVAHNNLPRITLETPNNVAEHKNGEIENNAPHKMTDEERQKYQRNLDVETYTRTLKGK